MYSLIALPILQFIGHLILSWLAFTSPAQAQATPQATFILDQSAQLEQTMALPFWKESASPFWSHLSESLEQSTTENEEDDEAGAALNPIKALCFVHGQQAAAAQKHRRHTAANIPLYLRYCSLKIDQV